MTDRNFWKGKRVFITGHTGFKGSWLTLWLHDLGAELTGYALPPETDPNIYTLARVGECIRPIFANICDAGGLARAMTEAKPEIVFHLAAQSLVRQSYADPVNTFATNVMGTVHVLDAIRHVGGVKAVVVVTSDKCYENNESAVAFRESDPLGGYDPYSSSKGCAELATAAYRRSFFNLNCFGDHGVAVATARAGNVIGGGDWAADRLLPDIVRSLSCGKSPVVRIPNAVRPWQHVLEPLSGYMLLAEKLFLEGPAYSESWNFGPDVSDGQTVGWVASRATEAWGGGAVWVPGTSGTAHEARILKLDCSKARERLRWRPKWDAETAISETIQWHKSVGDGADARESTLEQIGKYEHSPELVTT